MNRGFSGLADATFPLHLPFPSPSRLYSSWLLLHKLWNAFRYVSKGSSLVPYPFCYFVYCISLLWIAKEVQLFPVLGVYSGIFAIYLQCPSDESRTRRADVVFHSIICLLYVFCAAVVVSDLISFSVQVCNKFICKNIIFIISCTVL